MSITILLADPYPVIREGLKAVFSSHQDCCIIAETGDGLQAIELAKRLRPNVLFIDAMMPGLNGLEVIWQIHHWVPHTRVIVLSVYTNEVYVLEALHCGASGYVLKNADNSELLQATHDVVAGRCYLSPSIAERLGEFQAQRRQIGVLDLYDTLTMREREVLFLIAEGYTNAMMAATMQISPRTVETHRAHLMHKLGLHTQLDLIRYTLRRGILPLEK